MLRRNFLTLSFVTNEIFENKKHREQFFVYLNSAKRNISDCDYVLLTHNLTSEWEQVLKNQGAWVVFVKTPIEHLFRDRHLCYRNYLLDHGHKYKHILISDSRDVFVQKNPFDWIKSYKKRFDKIKGNHNFLNNFVILTTEGFKMSRSGFATVENFKFERDISPSYRADTKDQWVVNGGVSLGTPDALKNFHFLIWSIMSKNTKDYTDQAAINWVFSFLKDDQSYSVSFPQHDNLCLTGEGVNEGVVEPYYENGFIKNSFLKQPYCLVHQWDRIESESLKYILEEYSLSDSF